MLSFFMIFLAGGNMTKQDILCFRAFDLRGHFTEPVETFRQALELLQSDRAYLPEESSAIICYLKNGKSIKIPHAFYCTDVPYFNSEAEVKAWLLEHNREAEKESDWGWHGIALADPDLPLDAQINEALSYSNNEIITSDKNDQACIKVNDWLNQAISERDIE